MAKATPSVKSIWEKEWYHLGVHQGVSSMYGRAAMLLPKVLLDIFLDILCNSERPCSGEVVKPGTGAERDY